MDYGETSALPGFAIHSENNMLQQSINMQTVSFQSDD